MPQLISSFKLTVLRLILISVMRILHLCLVLFLLSLAIFFSLVKIEVFLVLVRLLVFLVNLFLRCSMVFSSKKILTRMGSARPGENLHGALDPVLARAAVLYFADAASLFDDKIKFKIKKYS